MSDGVLKGGIIVALFALLCLGCGGCFVFHDTTTSEGFRDGQLQKLNTTGLIWKTHEGELALAGIKTRGTGDNAKVGNTWDFSVVDAEVLRQLQAIPPDAHVRLSYRRMVCMFPWQGTSGYLVTKVERVKPGTEQ